MAVKLIPCRVCGKMFKPCFYCQEHSDIFRWRNFACSLECAKKYINETIEYRETQKHKEKNMGEIESNMEKHSTNTTNIRKRKAIKKELETVTDTV